MATRDSSLFLTNDDLYMMGKGVWYRSYEKMGAHPAVRGSKHGYHFAVWAPDAKSVHVIGDFNDWNPEANALECTETGGVWEGFIEGVVEDQLYKYLIETPQGDYLYKADPYAFSAELIPGTASKTTDITGYKWQDSKYMTERKKSQHMKRPLNIFEVHLGSWKRHDDGLAGNGDPDSDDTSGTYLTYDELSVELVKYVKEMGYSHIELLPVMEHPFDGSWGYQVTGYYAPTSRYGTPKQFKHFVDACHAAGIGVILDWVPGGFCADAQGLANFVGDKLYEKEIHPNWGTYKFDFTRGEVNTFLISNLLYWVGEYHADGIRVDGVTSMLYLNFGIDDPGQKKFNENGTEEDYISIEFVRTCNNTMGKYYPDVMMIAEESTAWPLVTRPSDVKGLGFNYKWDMGWMHDTLHYMQTDFPYRPGNHNLLTFSIMYAFNENFILSFSHDEVVHGKCSLITRMPGDYWRQFAGMRALGLYQMTHPGGKLNFMGNEIGQFIEWRYYEGIQYFLAEEHEKHGQLQKYNAQLNKFYNNSPALWERSYTEDGFEWVDADNSDQCMLSYVRHGDNPDDDLLVVLNFEVNPYEEYRIGVPTAGYWQEVFNSDAEEFGGSGVTNGKHKFRSEATAWNGKDNSIVVRVPPLGGMVLRYAGPLPKPRAKKATSTKTTAAKTTATKTTAAKKTTATKATTAAKATAAAETEKAPATKKAASTTKKATATTAAKKTTASKASTEKAAATTKKAAEKPAATTKKPAATTKKATATTAAKKTTATTAAKKATASKASTEKAASEE